MVTNLLTQFHRDMSILEQIDHSVILLTLEKHLTIDNVIVITDQVNVINPAFSGKRKLYEE